MKQRILVIAGHVGDFVWRSGGTIAKAAREGHEVHLIVLTLGLRGESNGYWKRPGSNIEEGRILRRAEGEQAASLLGVKTVEIMDRVDYPLVIDRPLLYHLARRVRELRPDIIITHDGQRDLFNADHTLIGKKVNDLCDIAASPEVELEGLSPVKQPAILGFEPHIAELCGFVPRVYVDISETFPIKRQAMEFYALTQKGMFAPYTAKNLLRAAQTGDPKCRYAEAFSVQYPNRELDCIVLRRRDAYADQA